MTIALLDDFNRSNGAPGSNWGAAISTYSLPDISGNELDWPAFPSAYWAAQQFAADQGAQCYLGTVVESQYFLLRLTNPGGGAEVGYVVYGSWGGSTPAEAWRMTNGIANQTSLGFANGIMAVTDKWMRATVEGTSLKLYGGTDGVNWNLRQTWTDGNITGAGYIGIFNPNNVTPGTIDNFGGGDLNDTAPAGDAGPKVLITQANRQVW